MINKPPYTHLHRARKYARKMEQAAKHPNPSHVSYYTDLYGMMFIDYACRVAEKGYVIDLSGGRNYARLIPLVRDRR